jgi:hypothetical protein
MKELEINLDLDMLRVPCQLLDINFLSSQGSSQSLKKTRITKSGEYLPFDYGNTDIEDITKAVKAGEGCKLSGTLFNHFLRPQITIGYGGVPPPILMYLMDNIPEFSLNLSHKFNSFSIGKTGDCLTSMLGLGLNPHGCFGLTGHSRIENSTVYKKGQYARHSYFVDVG